MVSRQSGGRAQCITAALGTVAHVLKVVVHHPVLNIKAPSSSIKETRRRCASTSPQSHGMKKKRGKIDYKTFDFFSPRPCFLPFFVGCIVRPTFAFIHLGRVLTCHILSVGTSLILASHQEEASTSVGGCFFPPRSQMKKISSCHTLQKTWDLYSL